MIVVVLMLIAYLVYVVINEKDEQNNPLDEYH